MPKAEVSTGDPRPYDNAIIIMRLLLRSFAALRMTVKIINIVILRRLSRRIAGLICSIYAPHIPPAAQFFSCIYFDFSIK